MTRATKFCRPLEERYPPMELVIPRAPKTANRMLRSHWAAQRREVSAWSAEIRAQAMPGPWLDMRKLTEERRRVEVEVVVTRKKAQDPDNARASLKALLDGLKRQGWCVDDSPAYFELKNSEVVGKVPQTVIRWRMLP